MSSKKAFWIPVLLAGSLGAVPALATEIFSLNQDYCSNTCLGGSVGGTVTISQFATNVVDVLVQLNSPLAFHKSGLDSFGFNIWDTTNSALQEPTLTLTTAAGAPGAGQLKIINDGGSTWTLSRPSGNLNPAGGPFGYSLNCTAAPGVCAGSPVTLEFQVNLTGLTDINFETLHGTSSNTTTVDFAANVANGSCTGVIGGGNGTGQSSLLVGGGTACGAITTTPEPSTLGLVGLSLAGLGGLRLRRRNRRA